MPDFEGSREARHRAAHRLEGGLIDPHLVDLLDARLHRSHNRGRPRQISAARDLATRRAHALRVVESIAASHATAARPPPPPLVPPAGPRRLRRPPRSHAHPDASSSSRSASRPARRSDLATSPLEARARPGFERTRTRPWIARAGGGSGLRARPPFRPGAAPRAGSRAESCRVSRSRARSTWALDSSRELTARRSLPRKSIRCQRWIPACVRDVGRASAIPGRRFSAAIDRCQACSSIAGRSVDTPAVGDIVVQPAARADEGSARRFADGRSCRPGPSRSRPDRRWFPRRGRSAPRSARPRRCRSCAQSGRDCRSWRPRRIRVSSRVARSTVEFAPISTSSSTTTQPRWAIATGRPRLVGHVAEAVRPEYHAGLEHHAIAHASVFPQYDAGMDPAIRADVDLGHQGRVRGEDAARTDATSRSDRRRRRAIEEVGSTVAVGSTCAPAAIPTGGPSHGRKGRDQAREIMGRPRTAQTRTAAQVDAGRRDHGTRLADALSAGRQPPRRARRPAHPTWPVRGRRIPRSRGSASPSTGQPTALASSANRIGRGVRGTI